MVPGWTEKRDNCPSIPCCKQTILPHGQGFKNNCQVPKLTGWSYHERKQCQCMCCVHVECCVCVFVSALVATWCFLLSHCVYKQLDKRPSTHILHACINICRRSLFKRLYPYVTLYCLSSIPSHSLSLSLSLSLTFPLRCPSLPPFLPALIPLHSSQFFPL